LKAQTHATGRPSVAGLFDRYSTEETLQQRAQRRDVKDAL